MSERVRSVVVGIALGAVLLLLLDLARILHAAIERDGDTSVWWPVACYLGAGAIVAAAVAMGRRERLVPGVAALAVALVALPSVWSGAAWLPQLPLVPTTAAAQAVAFAGVGALVYGAVRGGRA